MTRMIVLGDSILAGWTGSANANPTIPQTIANINHWEVDNQAISGTKYGNNHKDNFVDVVKRLNFANYDLALIGYGINDFDDKPYDDLTDIETALNNGYELMLKSNPSITLYVELPTPSFVCGDSLNQPNDNNITQNMIMNTIVNWCKQHNVEYYDWREHPIITAENHQQTLGDRVIHPNQDTMNKMGTALAVWLKPKGLVGEYAENIRSIYQRITKMYQDVNKVFMSGEAPRLRLDAIQNPNGERNLAVYLWTVKATQDLETAINNLVTVFNTYNLIDVMTGLPTDEIKLWIPVLDLTLNSDYEKKMKHNFKLANDLLDQLLVYLKPYIKG